MKDELENPAMYVEISGGFVKRDGCYILNLNLQDRLLWQNMYNTEKKKHAAFPNKF